MAAGGWTALAAHEVEASIGRFPGIYLLRKQGTRCVVGRADGDVREQLLAHVGSEYSEYWAFTLPSAQEAYESECCLWHTLGGEGGLLDNPGHPTPTAESNWWCPMCEKSALLRALLTTDNIEPVLIVLGLAKRSPAST